MEANNKERIAELDGLRAFAVTGVITYHMASFSGVLRVGSPFVQNCFNFGSLGVEIFFVISGFIITTLLLGELDKNGRICMRAFYTRRFFRIVPALVFYLLGLLCFKFFGIVIVGYRNFISAILFLENVQIFDQWNWFVGHIWTLSTEEQFYISFPPALYCALKCGRKFTSVVAVIVFLACTCALKIAHECSVHIDPKLINLSCFYGFRHIVIGVLVALNRKLITSFIGTTSPIYGASLAIGFFLIWYSRKIDAIFGPGVAILEPCICGLLVIWFVQNPAYCGFLRWKPVQWVGACSYSLYLWQQLFTGEPAFYHNEVLIKIPICLVGIVFFSCFSRYAIEMPFIRLGRRLSRSIRLKDKALSVLPRSEILHLGS